ncbi:hypothetical protein BD779DRAFT_1680833 [Infundibulicybe gibba]|nr:hypothetical protein BD779DRAFT_1680833 [Infundibulicybe gibba]
MTPSTTRSGPGSGRQAGGYPRRAGEWEANTSRAFGLFHLFSAITPRPSIREWNLTESDEFLIIANHQFWEYITYQVAVDIVQSVIENLEVATQKLLEMALGFGAEAGVCVMVVSLSELYEAALPSPATIEIGPAEAPPPKPLKG